MQNDFILDIRNAKKYFYLRRGVIFSKTIGVIKAVDGVDLKLYEGETFGLVGESGCGKTTVAKLLVKVLNPTEGKILYKGTDITKMAKRSTRDYHQEVQLIFQDPYSSLNPKMTIGNAIAEPALAHHILKKDEVTDRVIELLNLVGISPYSMSYYPHEFSGGQRQRINIARALIMSPKVIIADEPVSALDVSIKVQVINLLQEIQNRLQLTYLFISHDLGIVRHISSRVGVMYLGEIVESAGVDEIFSNARHPYSQALLSSIPSIKKSREPKMVLAGEVPTPLNPPSGCKFHPRCEFKKPICIEQAPPNREVIKKHYVRCHFVN